MAVHPIAWLMGSLLSGIQFQRKDVSLYLSRKESALLVLLFTHIDVWQHIVSGFGVHTDGVFF